MALPADAGSHHAPARLDIVFVSARPLRPVFYNNRLHTPEYISRDHF